MAREKKLVSVRAYGLIREELRAYTKKLAKGYDRVRRRFIGEMVAGMVKSGRSLLSELARAIHRSGSAVSLHGEEKRLSQELKSPKWEAERLLANHHQVVAGSGMRLEAETIIAVDIFDVNKEGAHIFEHLTRVWDGSEKEKVDGFWALDIEAIKKKGEHLPLYMKLFSDKAPGFRSQFDELTRGVGEVTGAFGRLGLWVMDKGFDSLQNFLYFQGQNLSCLIRGFHDRMVERTSGTPEHILALIQSLPLPGVDGFFKHYVLAHRGRRRQWVRRETRMHYGFFRLEIVHGRQEEPQERARLPLWVIVSEGVGKPGERSFFYTNVPVETLAEAHRLLKKYAHRWSVEEAIRFVKQAFELEDVRVQSYVSLQRMMTFCQLAYTFLCLVVRRWPTQRKRLYWWLHELTPRRRGEKAPPFPLYRILEAIQKILALEFFGSFGVAGAT